MVVKRLKKLNVNTLYDLVASKYSDVADALKEMQLMEHACLLKLNKNK